MAVDTVHPRYAELLAVWEKCNDVYAGEEKVKSKGTLYLPGTSGMYADGLGNGTGKSKGDLAYAAYVTRAVFPNSMEDAVEVLLGMMHHKPAEFELPPELEPLRISASNYGETLQMLLRRINERQLVGGRVGLFLDLPVTPTQGPILPKIVLYEEMSITNWDSGSQALAPDSILELVVLEETAFVRVDDFTWENQEKYRVLRLGQADPNQPTQPQTGSGLVYSVDVYTGTTLVDTITPSVRGAFLEEIPFVFVNAKDILAEPDNPPLLGLANLALAIYRGEADLRHALFMQGQDTLVIMGGPKEKEYRVGANAQLTVPMGGDAKYIGVASDGLTEMRKNIENDKKMASHRGAQMTDTTSRQKESGDALRTRVGAQTATLNQVALAGGEGLEKTLKLLARWIGADPSKVRVKVNRDFTDDTMAGKDMVDMMTSKTMGFPISMQSLHDVARRFGLTDKNFEEEMDLIEMEPPLPQGTDAGGNPPRAADTPPTPLEPDVTDDETESDAD